MGLWYTELHLPTGRALAAATEKGFCRLDLRPGPSGAWLKMLQAGFGEKPVRDDKRFTKLNSELAAYFKGRAGKFSVPLDTRGTAFQELVWSALRKLPYGQVVTYGALARAINRPKAARAVGGALNANPVPIIIPCHRVVAAGGAIGGFGCGVDVKRALLEIEGVFLSDEANAVRRLKTA